MGNSISSGGGAECARCGAILSVSIYAITLIVTCHVFGVDVGENCEWAGVPIVFGGGWRVWERLPSGRIDKLSKSLKRLLPSDRFNPME